MDKFKYLRRWLTYFVFIFACGAAMSVRAQTDPAAASKAELQAAWAAAARKATRGPADIKLTDQASLKIVSGEAFIPAAEADRIMVALGNPSQPVRQGMVVSTDDKAFWMVDVRWIKEGYVRDGEAKEWKSDALLASLRDGTERGNENRTARGYPALDVVGWVEEPRYDEATHRLIWSLALQERGSSADTPRTINYNTYALGREGYFSLDLITGSDTIAADKHVALQLLSTLTFVPGKQYADFDESTDKVAAYGIGALVGVIAAKKLGLLAMAGLLLVKLWKLAIVGFLAVGAFVRRILGRRKEEEELAEEPEISEAQRVAAATDEEKPAPALAEKSSEAARLDG